MSESRKIFTLKQVMLSVRKTLETRYKQSYWVKAEMHKLNLSTSGHAFPELVHKENETIHAQINATIWKGNLQRINQTFVEVVKEPLQEGTTLLMQVNIVFHELYGLSLNILEIDPSFTLGELQKERALTLQRLEKQGLLNLNQKLNFPLLPKRIAVISAENSKGYADFMEVLQRNPAAYRFTTFLFPAYLQGDVAVTSIKDQLERIRKVSHFFDIVAIVRGGGGEVGLSCYNHFDLCASIATFPLPILTGIGHSTNITVAEMVAFRNAITPTELADFLIQSFDEVNTPLLEASKLIKQATRNMLSNEQKKLVSSAQLLNKSAKINLQFWGEKLRLELLQTKLEVKAKLLSERDLIQHQGMMLGQTTNRIFRLSNMVLKDKMDQLCPSVSRYLDNHQKELGFIEVRVEILDPVHVLKRGYSIARINGVNLVDIVQTNVGDTLEIESYKWLLNATISKTQKNE